MWLPFLIFTNMEKVILFLSILFTTILPAQVRVMTYNIRYDNPGDGENRWELRRGHLAQQILFYDPDFIGTQEGKKHQLEYLDQMLPSHVFIGKGRDDSADGGEYSALFYNREKFDLLENGTFWLSETPEKISKGWDGDFNRICTWGLFQDKVSSQKLLVLNTHLDHVGELARLNGVKLIVSKISEINTKNYPVVLTGDFNCTPDSAPYAEIAKTLSDSRTKGVRSFGPGGTFNGFNFHQPVKTLIDFIFVSDNITVKKHAVPSDSKDCRYPSDHLPVLADIVLK